MPSTAGFIDAATSFEVDGGTFRWRRDHGGMEPIYLDDMGYDWHDGRQGWRNSYRLPGRVAEQITAFLSAAHSDERSAVAV